MIVVHASLSVDPDRRDEALEFVETLVERSNREAGMIDYRATVDLRDRNTVRFFERYEDEAALAAHTRTDHFREFEERLPELFVGRPEILRFDVDSATELEL